MRQVKKEEIGKLITYLRKKKNIGLEQLCRGICSKAVMIRLEQGERVPDFFMLERIMERLGKSVNKIELIYDEQCYEIYYLREVLENYLEEKQYEEVVEGLNYYESLEVSQQPLHRQYIYKLRAVLEEEYYGNLRKSIEYLEQAMKLTLPDFDISKMEQFALGEEEIVLLLMWLERKSKTEEMNIISYKKRLLENIRYYFDDEEVFVSAYGKASWIVMEELIKQGRKEEAADIGVQMIDTLADNAVLLNIPEFLERILICYKDIDQRKYTEWKQQRDALKWVYDSYDKVYEPGAIKLWKRNRQCEIYLMSEVIGQERKLLKVSQEKLADKLEIDTKTISRIERGKYKPKPGTFAKLKKYMDIDRDICSTNLVVDKFETLELEREVSKEIYFKRYQKAEELYQQLKEELSMEYNENRQYVIHNDVIFDVLNNRISKEVAIERCWAALAVTRSNHSIEDLAKIVLNRHEARIISYMARMYNDLGDKEKAIYLLEKALMGYENSKVDLKYHYVSVAMLYESLSGEYEENNQFDKAIAYCDKAVVYDIRCGRISTLGWCVTQKIYTEERKNGKSQACANKYRQAYQLLKLAKKNSNMRTIEKIYRNNYGKEIY